MIRCRNDRNDDGSLVYLAVLPKVGAAKAIVMIARNVTRRISPPNAGGCR